MNIEDLKALGFTPEQLFDRVADNITDQILSGRYDPDGEFGEDNKYMTTMNNKIANRIDESIVKIVETQILPGVPQQIEDIVMQKTNSWGEKQGATFTFVEYLIDRANHYINEMVDYEGKSKSENRSSYGGFKGTQTRLTHMVDKHLHFNINRAMETFLAEANNQLSGAMAATAKIKMEEIASKIKVTVKT